MTEHSIIQFKDVSLEEACHMGRGPRMDSMLYDTLRRKIQGLSEQAARIRLAPEMSPTRMKNYLLRIARRQRPSDGPSPSRGRVPLFNRRTRPRPRRPPKRAALTRATRGLLRSLIGTQSSLDRRVHLPHAKVGEFQEFSYVVGDHNMHDPFAARNACTLPS